MGQKGCYDVVADDDALLIQGVALERAAVAVGRLADDLVNALAALLRGRIHPVVEQGVQPAGVKAGWRRVIPLVVPQGVEVVFVAVEGKLSLAADEVDEQQLVEQGLHIGGGVSGRHLGGEFGGGGVVGGLVIPEERFGDGLDVEPVLQGDLKGLAAGDGLADLLQSLQGGAVGLAPAVDEAVVGAQAADVVRFRFAVDELDAAVVGQGKDEQGRLPVSGVVAAF